MCLAIPAKIIAIDGTLATIDMEGVSREASMALLPEAQLGDYVLVHAGFAIQAIDEEEARATLALFAEMLGGSPEPPSGGPRA
jgi:hydrogenase expression/formation protein HypC